MKDRKIQNVDSLELAVEDVYDSISRIVDAANGLLAEKNEEIEQLKKELAMSVVVLDSEKELKAYNKFCKKHEKCQLTSKANGGKVPYIVLNGTGVGTCKKAVCQVCGAEQDITDIDVW